MEIVYADGNGSLALAGGYALAKVGQSFGILSKSCFVAGTQVLAGDSSDLSVFSEKKIEEIEVGDWVWSRDERNPDSPLELRPVTDVFHRTAYDLQKVSLQDADGEIEIINATDEHPFFVDGTGWVGAADLVVGNWVMQPDGTFLVVTGNSDDKRPEGAAVFNFTVEGNHTYFVEDGIGGNDWAWVHNTCAGRHHLFTRGFGSSLRHGDPALPYLTKTEHTLVHAKFSNFLESTTGFRYRSLSSGQWKSRFSGQLVDLTESFYRKLDRTSQGKKLAEAISRRNSLPQGTTFVDMLVAQLKLEGRNEI